MTDDDFRLETGWFAYQTFQAESIHKNFKIFVISG